MEAAVGWWMVLAAAADLDRARDQAVGEARALVEVVQHTALDRACRRLVELGAHYGPEPGPTEPEPGPPRA